MSLLCCRPDLLPPSRNVQVKLGIFAISSGLMAVMSLVCVQEQRRSERISLGEYRKSAWALMRSRAFFFVIAWQILNATFQNLVSTGWPFTRRYWIGVQVLTEQITKLMSYALFSLTVYVVRERFLHTNWRMMLLCSVVVIPIVDIPLGYANVYDIGWGRSQYFLMAISSLLVGCHAHHPSPWTSSSRILTLESYVFLAFPSHQCPVCSYVLCGSTDCVMFVVSCLIVVEHTSDGNEGLVYGLATSLTSLARPTKRDRKRGTGSMRPSLGDAPNYIPSEPSQKCFRDVVYVSFCMCMQRDYVRCLS